jgi:hypothetical protein
LRRRLENSEAAVVAIRKDTEYWMISHTEAENRAKFLETDLAEKSKWYRQEKEAGEKARFIGWILGTGLGLIVTLFLVPFLVKFFTK